MRVGCSPSSPPPGNSKLNLDDMLTREYSLEQINDGYRDMLEGRNIRGVIRYPDADR